MKTVHSILLLAALTEAANCLFLRKPAHVKQLMTWSEAQKYCRENYVDLLTIETKADLDDVKTDDFSWIGLYRASHRDSFTEWSDGSLLEFIKWADKEPDNNQNENFVCMKNSEYYDCYNTDNSYVFCYTWEPTAIVVQEMMTWEEALVHCRTFYTDLISLTDERDLLVANNISGNIQTPSVWTGFHFLDGFWFWVNAEPLGNLVLLPSCPAQPHLCGAQKTGDYVLENRNCEEKMNFICYH